MLLTEKQPAAQMYTELDKRVKDLSPVPGLFALYDPEDTPAGWYLRSILRAGEAHGIPVYASPLSEEWKLPEKKLGGMIVLSKTKLPVTIPEELDVDGRDPNSHHTLYVGGLSSFPRNTPCTAESCVRLLEYYGIPVSGRHAVILSRSMTVGRPLSMLLIDRDATVTVCHSRTQKLPELCRQADILVCATGKAGLIGKDCVHSGQTVINVGGDVLEEEVSAVVENYAPFKGGVGALTTAILLKHVTDMR